MRTGRTRCSNCRFNEIGLKGDHALRCAGRMGLKMRHDALKILLARAFKQAGFDVKMEQSGGLLDKRRPADVEVQDWVVIRIRVFNTSLALHIAIIESTAESHSSILRRDGVGAAATRYENRKRKKYDDIKGAFSPFVIEANGGFGKQAKKIVRELERRRKERQCIPNMRNSESFIPLGEINLVTAIGFELVRRNVRMILDRSPEEEPLIPTERSKIRMEISQKKRMIKKTGIETNNHYIESAPNELSGQALGDRTTADGAEAHSRTENQREIGHEPSTKSCTVENLVKNREDNLTEMNKSRKDLKEAENTLLSDTAEKMRRTTTRFLPRLARLISEKDSDRSTSSVQNGQFNDRMREGDATKPNIKSTPNELSGRTLGDSTTADGAEAHSRTANHQEISQEPSTKS